MTTAEVGTLLKTAAATLRTVTHERDAALTKLATVQKKDKAEKLASQMVERGMISHSDVQQKTAELIERDNLDVIEEALNLSAPEELAKIAQVGEEPSGAGMDPLTAFVLSQAG